MKTLIKSLFIATSLLIVSALMMSCDGLTEVQTFNEVQDEIIIDESTDIDRFTGQYFELEIIAYNCNINAYSLMVSNPTEGPIDYFRQDMFDVTWLGDESTELAKGIWLDCVGAGQFTVIVKNLKTGKSAKAQTILYDKL